MFDEQELCVRVLNGELGAEASFYKMFRPRLLRASSSFLGAQQSEAEDMVQDTFLVALPKLKNYNHRVPVYAWLHQICLRLCNARLRSRIGILRCLDDDLMKYMQRMVVERVQSENLEVQKQQKLELLRELIKQLKPDSRQIIQLRNVHGMTYAQITATLNISLATVIARLVAARDQIRELVEKLPLAA